MDFTLPEHLPGVLAEMDAFIEAEIKPLERDHIQYFDQRREHARTDWDNDGIPSPEWENLLAEMRRRANKAGWLRYGLPEVAVHHDRGRRPMTPRCARRLLSLA